MARMSFLVFKLSLTSNMTALFKKAVADARISS
jgi:hypothetical protein